MATPRVKRPFAGSASDPSQRRITNFFSRDETFPENKRSVATTCEPSMPSLPPTVQANLFTVGMRVRKALQEGYKTSKEDGDQWTTSGNLPVASSQLPSYKPQTTFSIPERRELVPFCGLHNIGGLRVQMLHDEPDNQSSVTTLFHSNAMDAESSEPPSLTTSQETVSSTASSSSAALLRQRYLQQSPGHQSRLAPASTRKRVLSTDESDEESELACGEFIHVYEDEEQLVNGSAMSAYSSPSINSWLKASSTHPPSINGAFYRQRARRVLAMPKRRQQQQHAQSWQQDVPCFRDSTQIGQVTIYDKPSCLSPDQENVDFGEADFLDASIMHAHDSTDMDMDG